MPKLKTRIGALRRLPALERFRRREDGAVAVEFVLIAPLMIAIYLGIFQISMVISQDRNVSHAASVMGDLATQVPQLDNQSIEDVFQAGANVLGVGETSEWSDISMELVSLRMVETGGTNPDGTPETSVEVVGKATIGSGFSDAASMSFDSRILNTTSGAVVARIRYDYSLISNSGSASDNDWINGQYMLTEDFVLKPRVSEEVMFSDATDVTCTITNGTVDCPAPSGGAPN